MSQPQPILPFYFGSCGRELFGCYHGPGQNGIRECAILVCQPFGHEYINSHRALRQLAARLAEAGFPVLRFDYYGCGDSSGEAEQGSLTRWMEDISAATGELRARSGMREVCVVGLRLGATLAAVTGSRRKDFKALVLWEPVVEGETYLEELLDLQQEMLRFRPKPMGTAKHHAHMEVLGFPISRMLRSQFEELDHGWIDGRPARRVLLLQSKSTPGDDRLKAHLIQNRTDVEHLRVEAPQIWLPTPDGSLLVPVQALQSMVSWICGATS